MTPIKIAIIGYGKIAEDQHVPSIRGNDRFQLVATSSRSGQGVEQTFGDWRELIRQVQGLQAVAITTPPEPRFEIARECIAAGLHCLLEKPPAAGLSQIADLDCQAQAQGVTLFTTWHAQHHPTVDAAAKALAGKRIRSMEVLWHEDVHKWHPGQRWIWEPGGFGVFDPGINALSIATLLCPEPLLVRTSDLRMEKRGHQPEGVVLKLATGGVEEGIGARFEWRYRGTEQWTIDLTTKKGTKIALSKGGAVLRVNDGPEQKAERGEYPNLYARFAHLVAAGESDVDVAPLRIVADALLAGEKVTA